MGQMGTMPTDPNAIMMAQPGLQPGMLPPRDNHISTIINAFKDKKYTGAIDESWEDTVRK